MVCPSTYIEDPFPTNTIIFDLLADTEVLIPVPAFSAIPTSCYTVVWDIIRDSDSISMTTEMPAVFAISGD